MSSEPRPAKPAAAVPPKPAPPPAPAAPPKPGADPRAKPRPADPPLKPAADAPAAPAGDLGQARADSGPSEEERGLAMVAHLSGILTWSLGPLLIWLLKKDAPPYARQQVREALNFQLTLLVFDIIGSILLFAMCIGLVIIVPLWIVRLVLGIMATMACNDGKTYRYPFRLEMIK